MKKYSEADLWKYVAELGWGSKSTDYKSMQKGLQTKSKNFQEQFAAFVRRKKDKVSKIINDFEDEIGMGTKIPHPYSDDGFMDLTAHIVGLGKKEFDRVCKSPALAIERANDDAYEECFLYVLQS